MGVVRQVYAVVDQSNILVFDLTREESVAVCASPNEYLNMQ